MKNERKFFKCGRCGNIISFIKSSGADVSCCGEKMSVLTPNTTDAAKEKHVPVASRSENKLVVTVGSVQHPMTAEHQIEWIAVVDGKRTQRAVLSVTDAPSTEFIVGESPVTVYEYCNLHGLWEAQL